MAGEAGTWRKVKMKKIYVGNLSFNSTDDDVNQLFSQHGTVHSVALINDRETGRPRGFGFVEMDDGAAMTAISALDGHEMDGRSLRVNEAQDRQRNGGGNRGNRGW
jgi:RNA recognition motif-containing protein